MATDGPNPPACDQEIFDHGKCAAITHGLASNAAELYVKTIAYLSGQRVDWHYMGGRVKIMVLGDLDAVRDAIQKLQPLHDLLVIKNRSEVMEGYPLPTPYLV